MSRRILRQNKSGSSTPAAKLETPNTSKEFIESKEESPLQQIPDVVEHDASVAGDDFSLEGDPDANDEGEFDGIEIISGLFVGSEICAKDHQGRKSHGITHMITALSRFEVSFEAVGDMLQKGHWREYDIENRPVADLLSILDSAVDFINDAFRERGRVCVASLEGSSRSVSIVVAYLIKILKMSLKDATDLVYGLCPQASINRGFWRQLSCFESINLKSTSIDSDSLPGAIIFEKDELEQLLVRYRKGREAETNGPLSPTTATGIASLNIKTLSSPDNKRKGEYTWPSQKSPRGEGTF